MPQWTCPKCNIIMDSGHPCRACGRGLTEAFGAKLPTQREQEEQAREKAEWLMNPAEAAQASAKGCSHSGHCCPRGGRSEKRKPSSVGGRNLERHRGKGQSHFQTIGNTVLLGTDNWYSFLDCSSHRSHKINWRSSQGNIRNVTMKNIHIKSLYDFEKPKVR